MPLPSNGPISALDLLVAASRDRSDTSLDDLGIRALADNTVPQSQISYRDFYYIVPQWINEDFEITDYKNQGSYSSLTGWSFYNTQLFFNAGSKINNYSTPAFNRIVPNSPAGGTADASPTFISDYQTGLSTNVKNTAVSTSAAVLSTSVSYSSGNEYSISHGPYMVSNQSILLKGGYTLTFDYYIEPLDGSAADVFVYLLEKNSGKFVEILNINTDVDDGWQTATYHVLPKIKGNYYFVAVCGANDSTGSGNCSANFYIDSILVS
jgi:hypothetical protein